MGILDAPAYSRAQADASFRKMNPGRIVLIADDGYPSTMRIMTPRVEAAGGRMTIAVVQDWIANGGRLPLGAFKDFANRGHQIACHSKTHANLPGQTAANRLLEWQSKEYLETALGITVSTFVYPMSLYDDVTAREAYLRFDRALAGVADQYRWAPDTGRHFMGRLSWTNATHATVMAEVAAAWAAGETIIIYTHFADGSDLGAGVTVAQFDELIAYSIAKRMPFVTVDQAFPPLTNVRDGGFENPDPDLYWQKVDQSGAGTFASVVDTPDVNLPGTRSLKVTRTGPTGNTICYSRVAIPVLPGASYSLSGRVRRENYTTGGGGASLGLYEYTAAGTLIGSTVSSASITSTTWVREVVSRTMASNAAYILPAVRLVNSDGDAFFDHLHFDLTANGIRG